MSEQTTTETAYPQDALARQILAQGYVDTPSGTKIGNLSEAFGWAGIKASEISPDTLALALHCGLSNPSAGLWTYESADDHRTPEEIAAVQAALAAPRAPTGGSAGDAPEIKQEDIGTAAKPVDGTEKVHVLEPDEPSPVGKKAIIEHPDGTQQKIVVVPHGPLAELAKLVGEIRQYVGAGAHHLVARAEELAAELRAHL